MERKVISKKFWIYVIPSMLAMLLSGFYSIIDGLFVGNAVGSEALAAINIAYPIQVVLNATAIGVGIGGAIRMSCAKGAEDNADANKYFGNTLFLLVVAGIGLPCFFLAVHEPLLHILGAKGSLFAGARDYIIVILLGGILPVIGNGTNPLLRNDGYTRAATICMSMGLITNIILDYFFVFRFDMGLLGAGLATIIAQGIVALSSMLVLWIVRLKTMKLNFFRPSLKHIKKMVISGISPFGQTLVPCVVIIITNWIALKYGGNDAVTIYSIVTYVLASAQLLLQGIGDGVQPLFSFYFGAKKEAEIHYLYHKSFFLSIVCSLLLCVSVFLFVKPLAYLFGIDAGLYEECRMALLITALAFPAIGITRLTSAIFYATQKSYNSSFLVYIEPCVILPFFLITFSSLFGVTGIWAAYPIAQFTISSIALILKSPNITVPHLTEAKHSL